jgi:hypothetical protein
MIPTPAIPTKPASTRAILLSFFVFWRDFVGIYASLGDNLDQKSEMFF